MVNLDYIKKNQGKVMNTTFQKNITQLGLDKKEMTAMEKIIVIKNDLY